MLKLSLKSFSILFLLFLCFSNTVYSKSSDDAKSDLLKPSEEFNSMNPKAAALSTGLTLTVWVEISPLKIFPPFTTIWGRIYNKAGTPYTEPFKIVPDSPSRQNNPSISVINGDQWIVTWDYYLPNLDDGRVIMARIINADGSSQGNPFLIQAELQPDQSESRVLGLPQGGFIVSWLQGGRNLKAKVFTSNLRNTLKDDLEIATSGVEGQKYDIALLSNGDIVVVWEDGCKGTDCGHKGRILRIVDGIITLKGKSFEVNKQPGYVRVTGLNNGNFVVLWQKETTTVGKDRLMLGVFNPKTEKRISITRTNAMVRSYYKDAEILGLRDGGFLMLWQGKAKTYDNKGKKASEKVRITQNDFSEPFAVELPNKKLLAFWQSSADDINSQIFGRTVSIPKN